MPRKGTTTERGYGSDHQRERDRWVQYQQDGGDDRHGSLRCRAEVCVMPTEWIYPGQRWDLGHDGDREWRGPEHERCNRSEGTARGNRMRGRPRQRVHRGHLSVDARDL